MMEPEDAKEVFLQHINQSGQKFNTLRPADGIGLMIDFYVAERAQGCEFEQDGDMLLYQWGTYNQTYKGQRADWFDFNITRQLMFGEIGNTNEWEGEILQLSLTFKFLPSPILEAISSQNQWCSSLDNLPQFREFILNSPAYATVSYVPSADICLEFDSAE